MPISKIPFNKPYFTGKETQYIQNAVRLGKISGNGIYTKMCHEFFEEKYEFNKCLLTTSCTDALEMAAILIGIKPGDEVIMPSFTFVSSANAFVLRGAKIKFVDSKNDHPGMDEEKIEELISLQTKAIVVVHYAGVACDMDRIMDIANKHNLFVIEDAAQAIDSFYSGKDGIKRPLGSIGHLAAFSFHETKNIISGEGGMLVINDKKFKKRAEIVWEKGTNRAAFYRGEVDKYEWIDIGSSFLPSEIISAFLFAQLEQLQKIQNKRKKLWQHYFLKLEQLVKLHGFKLPIIPSYATNNAHIFYLVCSSEEEKNGLINHLKQNGIDAIFHYQSLAASKFYSEMMENETKENANKFSNCLIRLPMFYELKIREVDFICNSISNFYRKE